MGRFFAFGVLVGLALLGGSRAFAEDAAVRRCVDDPRPFDRYWRESVTPYFDSGTRHSFTRRGGVPIVYRAFPNRAATRSVAIFTGYAENALKHKETAYVFGCLGYSVYLLNWTGMGESGRVAGLPSRQIVHADSMAEYVADAETFLATIRERDRNPLYVFTHSTGGLIVANVLARNPTWARAAVMNAPLFELNLGSWPYLVATSVLRAEIALGRGKNYAIGYGDWNPRNASYRTNIGTRSQARYDRYIAEVSRFPGLWMGGPSNRWVQVILQETTHRKLASLAGRVTTPLLLYQAGDDRYVKPGGQHYFCSRNRDCRIRFFPGAYHEIYREWDTARVPAMTEAHAFFARH